MAQYLIAIILFCLLYVILHQYAPGYSLPFSICCSAVLILFVWRDAGSVWSQLSGFDSQLRGSTGASILFKAALFALVTQYAQLLCRDSGQSALSFVCIVCGKCFMALAALPLFRQFLDLISNLLV